MSLRSMVRLTSQQKVLKAKSGSPLEGPRHVSRLERGFEGYLRYPSLDCVCLLIELEGPLSTAIYSYPQFWMSLPNHQRTMAVMANQHGLYYKNWPLPLTSGVVQHSID